MAKAPLTPLHLHGVIGADYDLALPVPELELVAFRDIAAVTQPATGATLPRESGRHTLRDLTAREATGEVPLLSDAEVAAHRAVIDGLHRQAPVLPAPAGVIARDRAALLRWLEVHYVSFTEALAFVDGRCGARVYVTRAPVAASTGGPLDVPPLDLDGTATETFRALRRHASASTTLRRPETEVERASAAFLVETERWSLFADAVREADRRDEGIRVELSGPWPPYDFVKMQFGG